MRQRAIKAFYDPALRKAKTYDAQEAALKSLLHNYYKIGDLTIRVETKAQFQVRKYQRPIRQLPTASVYKPTFLTKIKSLFINTLQTVKSFYRRQKAIRKIQQTLKES